MGNSLRIVPVSRANFSSLPFLISKLADYEHLKGPAKAAKARLKRHCLGRKPKFEAYLALDGGTPVGYVLFFQAYSSFLARPTLFLEDLFVLKEHRGKGVGRKLFEFCIRRARRRKCGRMDFTVLDWNARAMDFYKRHGAKDTGWKYWRISFAD